MSKNNNSKKGQEIDENKLKGFFVKAIPTMPKPLAIICFILNILIPGLGTFISSFSVFFCATHHYDTNLKSFLINMLAFSLQLCSAIIIIGWIWSIKYGIAFVHLSGKPADKTVEADLPLFVRRHSSMESTQIYNKNKQRVSIPLAKVNEEETS